jgi:hypothetical protein
MIFIRLNGAINNLIDTHSIDQNKKETKSRPNHLKEKCELACGICSITNRHKH